MLGVPVLVNGTPAVALIVSGCSQTLFQGELIPDPEPNKTQIPLQCIHGDVRSYPTTWATLDISHRSAALPVGVAPKLDYPVILGWD